jgi:tRNA-dihydrouridine synthase B
MIKPLQIGNKIFSVNIIQGPLAGVSCAPFRLLTSRYSKPAFSYTEMISCKTLIYQSQSSQQRFVKKEKEEGPVCFQLAASEPDELMEATKRVTDYGADLIDLNCGCPVKKIRRKGAGSSLLTDPLKLYELIKSIKKNTHLPVSIKVRVEGEGHEKFHQEVAKVVSEAGADVLVVHGRHWSENYEIPCRYDQIQFFVETLQIPVIGNGDIRCVNSLRKMFQTGCAGVMISRAGVGQPWLIGKLMAEMNQEEFLIPSIQERGLILMEHVLKLAELLKSEKFAILQARKFGKYYARDLGNKANFCEKINVCESLLDLEKIIGEYYVNY